jgi:ABC-type nitrate/sulfonate/bicarbonate transport system permease component
MIRALNASNRMWLFVLPACVALAALVWAFVQPSEVCTSGDDVGVCVDHSAMKFFVGTVGVGIAVVIAAGLGFAIGLSRWAMAVWMGVGLTLIGVGVVSQIRVIT